MLEHPLRAYFLVRGPSMEAASAQLAAEVAALGAPCKARTLLAIAAGIRRPRPPLSEAISRATGIPEIVLLKWGRHLGAAASPDAA